MMKFSSKLSHQLVLLIIVIFAIVFLMLSVILPQVVIPITEKNIYNYLREPLEFVRADIDKNLVTTEIAYLYQFGDTVAYSDNLHDIIKFDNVSNILPKFSGDYGKFTYRNKVDNVRI